MIVIVRIESVHRFGRVFIGLVRSKPADLPEVSIDGRGYEWIKLDAEIAMIEGGLLEDKFFFGKARSRTLQSGVGAISSRWNTVVQL